MRDSELKKLIKSYTKPCRLNVEKNLFIRISAELTPTWVFLRRRGNIQTQLTLGRYGNAADEMTLAEAREEVARMRLQIKEGYDPSVEARRKKGRDITTFDDLAQDWIAEECSKLQNPQIPARIYNREIKEYVGTMRIDRVSGIDIRDILNRIVKSKRKAIANDALLHLKQIFKHGIRLGVTNSNPASAFSSKQAGGAEIARSRFLTTSEITIVFETFRKYKDHFVIQNYIALGLLLILGVRKTELTTAKWVEFDLEKREWYLPENRTKTKTSLVIPIPTQLINWLILLKILGAGSDYLFPSRRTSKKGHISSDTLNHALTNLFGRKTGKLESSTGDVFSPQGIAYFTVHDFRRTCRTLLESLGVAESVSEKCLNHKIPGVKGVYNHYAYFDERKAALQDLADHVFPQVDLLFPPY